MSNSPHRSSPLGPRGARESPSRSSAQASPIVSTTADETTEAFVTAPAPTTSPFAFISPFDVLAQTSPEPPKPKTRKASTSEVPSPASRTTSRTNLHADQQLSSIDALFSSATPPPSSAAPPPASNDSPQASSLHSTISDQTFDRSLLASSVISAGSDSDGNDFEQPDWAPVGIPVVGGEGRTVRIDVTSQNKETVDPRKVDVTPVTLFAIQPKWERGVRIGAWGRALSYGTKHGKVRVIDRVTGAKLLLKGQTVGVVDLAIAPAPEDSTNPDNGEAKKVRAVASVGLDNRLLVWKAPEEFQTNDPGYERMVEVLGAGKGDGPRFRLVRFHPLYPVVPVLAVALNDGSVVFLNLGNNPPAFATPGPKDESVFESAGSVAHTGAPICDMTFSPDGTALAVLSTDHTYTIRHTEEPYGVVRTERLPFGPNTLSCLTFLSSPHSRPTALAVSSNLGTVVHILPLSPSTRASPSYSIPAIEFVGKGDTDSSLNFGHMAYHSGSSTLFISNSIRGSLFAFRLAFDHSPEEDEAEDDVGLLALHASTLQPAASRAPWIDHLTEIATPEPVLSFILDDTAGDEKHLAALCCHPAGVHSLEFRHNRCEANGARAAVSDPLRRMSLEGSILVSSEVVVAVDVPAPGDVILTRARSMSIKREPTVDEVPEEDLNSPTEATAPEVPASESSQTPATTTSAPIKLSGPVVNAAIKSMKGKGARTPTDEARTIKLESPSPSADPVANAWATGNAGGLAAGKKGKGGYHSDGSAEVVREIKKLEESLPAKIGKVLQREMDKQAQRYDEDRTLDQAADTTRQETMLKLVSTTLTKNTSKLVETTIKEQIRTQVIPAISTLVESAVSEQIGRGVANALANTLPNELERLLYRPEITLHLARNFSTTISPALERTISSVLAGAIVPTIASSIQHAVDGVMQSVRQEMVDVRKEIVNEQSDALDFTEREVQHLRKDVTDLKAALARMESLVLSLRTQAPTTTTPLGTTPSDLYQHSSRQAEQPSGYNLPPIPRTSTPTAQYEDMFTNALQPENEPEFASLLYLVNGAPKTRVDALFPSGPGSPRSCISSAVILSLAFRLGQVFGSKTGPLDDDARRQLVWLRKALSAMDDKDEETAGYTPRIIESVISGLSSRQKALVREQDVRGAEAVREVLVFAKSRYAVFLGPRRLQAYQ
ncbi:hypothetical protein P7C70_g8556, partial [Phenoliferia sp. Uapishka_3]